MTDFSCTFHAFCLWIFLNSSANIFRDFDSFAQLELTLFFQLDRIKHLIPIVDSSGKLKECSGDRKTIFHRYVSWWWHLNYHYYSYQYLVISFLIVIIFQGPVTLSTWYHTQLFWGSWLLVSFLKQFYSF